MFRACQVLLVYTVVVTRCGSAQLVLDPTIPGQAWAPLADLSSNSNGFPVTRERYVAPDVLRGAGGSGASLSDPANLEDIADRGVGAPGDLVWLAGGNYDFVSKTNTSRPDGLLLLKCDGNATHPCVFRCAIGARCTLRGRVDVYANFLWLWGVEISDPNPDLAGGGCPFGVWGSPPNYYQGVRLINSHLHDNSSPTTFRNGMCSYGDLNTVIYGNVIVGGGHVIYTSNRFGQGTYKFIVDNYFVDVRGASAYVTQPGGGQKKYQNVAAYVESATHGMGDLSGMFFHRNIIHDGRFLLGGAYVAEHHNVVSQNIFARARCQLGYREPAQATIVDNFLGFSKLQYEYCWGSTGPSPPAPTVVQRNQIYYPDDIEFGSGESISFEPKQYDAGNAVVSTNIRAGTIWDENTYGPGSFWAGYQLNGVSTGGNFATWRNATGFDLTSTAGQSIFEKVILHRNIYDLTRAHLSVFNFQYPSSQTIAASICCHTGNQAWSLFNYTDLYTPAQTGTATDCASVQITTSRRFESFLVTTPAASSGDCRSQALGPDAVQLPGASSTSSAGTASSGTASTTELTSPGSKKLGLASRTGAATRLSIIFALLATGLSC